MSVIGKQIKKYRMEKGITQEQLGELVGVTTQAVSKWERGGTPDVELLPSLSEVLNVSIDALFGREEQNLSLSLIRQLCRMTEEEAYRYAFSICWAMEMGLLRQETMLDDFLGKFVEHTAITSDTTDYFSKVLNDGGISTVRLSPDFHHFFLMTEPKGGIRRQLRNPDVLCEVFKLFSDKKIMKIIFYLYSRLNTPIDTSLISKNTGIDMKETDRCMELLCKYGLANCQAVATANGEINSYMFNQESSVIPLLCYADEIGRENCHDFVRDFSRTKPLLSTDG